MKYKIIAGIGCKDEEWIIEKNLKSLSLFCDKIVVVDDCSTDKTVEICKSFDKVELHERPYHYWWLRDDAKHRQEVFNNISKHNPDYIIILDTDEITCPDIVDFFENINENINVWTLPLLHLYKNENNYRVDKFVSKYGQNINWNPYSGGERKKFIIKYCSNFNYKYDFSPDKSSTIVNSPYNCPGPLATTEKTRILHYGNLNLNKIGTELGKKQYKYSVIRSRVTGEHFNNLINRFNANHSEDTLELKEIDPKWHWKL